MNQHDIIRPIPAAAIADLSWVDAARLEKRIRRGARPIFRTQNGLLIEISWSKKEGVFTINNCSSTAYAWTLKAALRPVTQLNEQEGTHQELGDLRDGAIEEASK